MTAASAQQRAAEDTAIAVDAALNGDYAGLLAACCAIASDTPLALAHAAGLLAVATARLAVSLDCGLDADELLPAAGIPDDIVTGTMTAAAAVTAAVIDGDHAAAGQLLDTADTEQGIPALLADMVTLITMLAAAVFTPDTARQATELVARIDLSGT